MRNPPHKAGIHQYPAPYDLQMHPAPPTFRWTSKRDCQRSSPNAVNTIHGIESLYRRCGGSDFDGCLVFDEAHKAKNFNSAKEENSTKVSQAVIKIQVLILPDCNTARAAIRLRQGQGLGCTAVDMILVLCGHISPFSLRVASTSMRRTRPSIDIFD